MSSGRARRGGEHVVESERCCGHPVLVELAHGLRAASPSQFLECSQGSERRSVIASASCCGSRPRTMTPPSPTASAFPGASHAMTGRPRQSASSKLSGSPSQREVLSSASHAASKSRRSSRQPRSSIFGPAAISTSRCRGRRPRSASEVREPEAERGERPRARVAGPFAGEARRETAARHRLVQPEPHPRSAALLRVGASACSTPFAITSTFRESRRPRLATSARSSSLGQTMRSARDSAARVAVRATAPDASRAPKRVPSRGSIRIAGRESVGERPRPVQMDEIRPAKQLTDPGDGSPRRGSVSNPFPSVPG